MFLSAHPGVAWGVLGREACADTPAVLVAPFVKS